MLEEDMIDSLNVCSLGKYFKELSLGNIIRRKLAQWRSPDPAKQYERYLCNLITRNHRYLAKRISDNAIIATSKTARRNPIYIRLNRADPFIFDEVFIEEIYNLDNTRIGDRIEKIYQEILNIRVPLILDLGANVGYTSMYYASRYPRSFVVAIECEKDNFESLCKNIRPFSNIMAVRGAIDSESGQQMYVTDRDEESSTSYFRSCRFIVRPCSASLNSDTETIRTYTVNELIRLAGEVHPKIAPFLCKVDIEGYEKQLFSRNADWLREFYVLTGEGHDHIFPGEKTSYPMLHIAMKYGFDIGTHCSNFLCVRYD
jgi:FkbM family methyltransferase